MTQRKLKNWLNSFVEWTAPRSEATENMIIWTGLYTIAAVLRRRVWIPDDYMGSYSIYPNIYVMFVADAGDVRKTTTMNYAIDLLDGLDLTQSPTSLSKEALLQKLIEAPDASIYITSEEFSDIIHKSGNTMYEFLTSIYDGKRKYDASTVSRGAELVERPCANMIAASTPIWVSNNMPEDVIGGGFSSRVIFVYEYEPRQRVLFYRKKVNFDAIRKIGQDLKADLEHILTLEGPFKIEEDAEDYLEDWFQTQPKETNRHLKGYKARKHIHILKAAMIYSVCYKDELVITKHDIEMAQGFVEALEKNLPRTFERMGKNEYVVDMDAIVEYVNQHKKVSRTDLLNRFRGVATPIRLDELVSGLLESKRINAEYNSEEKTLYYLMG